MSLQLNKLSSIYTVKFLVEDDISNILLLCESNLIYYHYYKTQPTYENIKEVFTAIPPNTAINDKYFLGFYNQNKLVAILDLVAGFPNKDTAYIGWFIMNTEFQGKGIGTTIISELISYLRELNFKQINLAYIKNNPQAENFWIKNEFNSCGRDIKLDTYTLVQMERIL